VAKRKFEFLFNSREQAEPNCDASNLAAIAAKTVEITHFCKLKTTHSTLQALLPFHDYCVLDKSVQASHSLFVFATIGARGLACIEYI
jgi:hypothetical protein